jgi:hypothetical protein
MGLVWRKLATVTECHHPKEGLFYCLFNLPFILCVFEHNMYAFFLFCRIKINLVSEYNHAFSGEQILSVSFFIDDINSSVKDFLFMIYSIDKWS